MTATAASKVENPTNFTSLSSTPSYSGKAAPLSGGGVSKGKPVEKMTAGEDGGGEFNDVKKKIRRAERFGVPVQLSEQEKRNSRAERFGAGAVANGIDTLKQSEELKRKARAERFEITHSDAADEESKKQARLARFGSVSSYDSAEDEKKKARALRFS